MIEMLVGIVIGCITLAVLAAVFDKMVSYGRANNIVAKKEKTPDDGASSVRREI